MLINSFKLELYHYLHYFLNKVKENIFETSSQENLAHKVSPQSADPVPLYSVYSKLQNVNNVFLDRNPMFILCSLLYIVYRAAGSVDWGDTL